MAFRADSGGGLQCRDVVVFAQELASRAKLAGTHGSTFALNEDIQQGWHPPPRRAHAFHSLLRLKRFDEDAREAAVEAVAAHLLSVRCAPADIIDGELSVRVPRTVLVPAKGLLLHVWNDRAAARRFQTAYQRLSQAKYDVMLPGLFHVPLAALVRFQGCLVSVVWLPPLSTAPPVTLAQGSVAAGLRDTWRIAAAATNGPLRLHGGMDGRLYAVLAGDVVGHTVSNPAVKSKRFAWEAYPLQPAGCLRTELVLPHAAHSDDAAIPITELDRRVQLAASALIAELRPPARQRTVAMRSPSRVAQFLGRGTVSDVLHAHGVNVCAAYRVLEALQPASRAKEDEPWAQQAADLLWADMIARTLKSLLCDALQNAPIPGHGPVEAVEFERLEAVSQVLRRFLKSAAFFDDDLHFHLREKFAVPDAIGRDRSTLQHCLGQVVARALDRLGMHLDSDSKRDVDAFTPLVALKLSTVQIPAPGGDAGDVRGVHEQLGSIVNARGAVGRLRWCAHRALQQQALEAAVSEHVQELRSRDSAPLHHGIALALVAALSASELDPLLPELLSRFAQGYAADPWTACCIGQAFLVLARTVIEKEESGAQDFQAVASAVKMAAMWLGPSCVALGGTSPWQFCLAAIDAMQTAGGEGILSLTQATSRAMTRDIVTLAREAVGFGAHWELRALSIAGSLAAASVPALVGSVGRSLSLDPKPWGVLLASTVQILLPCLDDVDAARATRAAVFLAVAVVAVGAPAVITILNESGLADDVAAKALRRVLANCTSGAVVRRDSSSWRATGEVLRLLLQTGHAEVVPALLWLLDGVEGDDPGAAEGLAEPVRLLARVRRYAASWRRGPSLQRLEKTEAFRRDALSAHQDLALVGCFTRAEAAGRSALLAAEHGELCQLVDATPLLLQTPEPPSLTLAPPELSAPRPPVSRSLIFAGDSCRYISALHRCGDVDTRALSQCIAVAQRQDDTSTVEPDGAVTSSFDSSEGDNRRSRPKLPGHLVLSPWQRARQLKARRETRLRSGPSLAVARVSAVAEETPPAKEVLPVRPKDEAPAKAVLPVKPKDEAPAKEVLLVRPKDEAPTKEVLLVKPKDEAPAKEVLLVRPKDEAPAKEVLPVKPEDEAPAKVEEAPPAKEVLLVKPKDEAPTKEVLPVRPKDEAPAKEVLLVKPKDEAPTKEVLPVRPKDEAPTKEVLPVKPKDEAPTKEVLPVRPKDEAPAKEVLLVRPKDEAPTKEVLLVKPKDEAPAKEVLLVRPKDEAPTKEVLPVKPEDEAPAKVEEAPPAKEVLPAIPKDEAAVKETPQTNTAPSSEQQSAKPRLGASKLPVRAAAGARIVKPKPAAKPTAKPAVGRAPVPKATGSTSPKPAAKPAALSPGKRPAARGAVARLLTNSTTAPRRKA